MFTLTRETVGFSPNKLRVDLSVIAKNYLSIKELTGRECAANLKANAFSLGTSPIMRRLSKTGCNRFFVDDIAAGISLRNLSLTDEIYVLNGVFIGEEAEFSQHQIIPVLNNKEQFELFNNHCLRKEKNFQAAININTNYIGFSFQEAMELTQRGFFNQKINLRLITTDELNLEQIKNINLQLPIATSYKTDSKFDLLKLSTELYGTTQSALSLYSQVIQLKETADGKILATIPLGFANGILPRLAENGIFYINGEAAPITAEISMGHTLIDVSKINPHFLHMGTQVEILGENSKIEDLAKASGSTTEQVILSLANGLPKTYI